MVKLQETKGRFFITVPAELVAQKSWSKGQNILMLFNERGNIELVDNMKRS